MVRCGCGAVAFIFSIYLKPVLYQYGIQNLCLGQSKIQLVGSGSVFFTIFKEPNVVKIIFDMFFLIFLDKNTCFPLFGPKVRCFIILFYFFQKSSKRSRVGVFCYGGYFFENLQNTLGSGVFC